MNLEPKELTNIKIKANFKGGHNLLYEKTN